MKRDGTDEWTAEELALVKNGQNIDAIKCYRNRTGCSLFDAKTSWDRVRAGIDPSHTRLCGYCGGKGWLPVKAPAGHDINAVTVSELLKSLAATGTRECNVICYDKRVHDDWCEHERAKAAIVAINNELARLQPEAP